MGDLFLFVYNFFKKYGKLLKIANNKTLDPPLSSYIGLFSLSFRVRVEILDFREDGKVCILYYGLLTTWIQKKKGKLF